MTLEATVARSGQNRFTPRIGAGRRATGASWLLCRNGAVLAALPIENVVESMRALPMVQVAGAPPYVLGLSIIRGAPVPVVDIGLIVNGAPGRAARLVTVRTAGRSIALAMDEVIGIAAVAADAVAKLPPLLHDAAAETIAGLGAADAELLVFLRTGRLVPEDVLARLAAEGARS
jgi:purine-binding chemotaxis protein CheW